MSEPASRAEPALLGRVLPGVVLWLLALALLVPAAVLTTLRLLEPQGGRAVRLVSFTPLALPLYAGALLILLVAAVRRSPSRRPRLAGALVALVGVGLHAWWLAPSYVGTAPAPAPGGEAITVMTANLYVGRGDADQVVAAVRERDVDLLVLEEVSTSALADLDSAGLSQLLPQRIGEPVPDDGSAGTMVFAADALGPIGTPTPVATDHQSWLVDIGTGATALRVLAVHPVAPTTIEQWHVDQGVILAAARAHRPDLVVGDFNATPDHEPVQALARAGWRDVGELADVGWQPTWPANGLGPFASLPPLVRIDHVLVDSTLAALGTSTVDIAGTDHLGLVARVARR